MPKPNLPIKASDLIPLLVADIAYEGLTPSEAGRRHGLKKPEVIRILETKAGEESFRLALGRKLEIVSDCKLVHAVNRISKLEKTVTDNLDVPDDDPKYVEKQRIGLQALKLLREEVTERDALDRESGNVGLQINLNVLNYGEGEQTHLGRSPSELGDPSSSLCVEEAR